MPREKKKQELLNEYKNRIDPILRNYIYINGDLDDNDFLTESFFDNSTVSPMKKVILRDLTRMFKEKIYKLEN